MTSYICVVPFKELGLGLSEEQVSEEEAHNLTDGFSLPALKVSSPRRAYAMQAPGENLCCHEVLWLGHPSL